MSKLSEASLDGPSSVVSPNMSGITINIRANANNSRVRALDTQDDHKVSSISDVANVSNISLDNSNSSLTYCYNVANTDEFIVLLAKLNSNDPKVKSIDLRSFTSITQEQLVELRESINNSEHIGHIYFGKLPSNCDDIVKAIVELLISNNSAYRYFPSDYVYGLLSMHSYIDSKADDEVKFGNDARDKLLADWRVHKVYDSRKDSGYYGVSYINSQTGQLILVHRGTELNVKDLFKNESSLKATKGVMGGVIIAQQAEAYAITKELVDEAKEVGYSFSVSGHSLGAYLAELSAYYCYFDFDYEGIKAVTFDSPGSKAMMDQYRSHVINRKTKKDVTELDMTSYLSMPSILNSCNEHVGTVYRLYPKISQEGFLSKLQGYSRKIPLVGEGIEQKLNALKNLYGYSLISMLEQFDAKSGLPTDYEEVLDWPCAKYVAGDGVVRSTVDSVIDKIPFSSYVPQFLTGAAAKLVSAGVNKLIGERTLTSLIDLLADLSGDNFKQDEYWSYLKYADSANDNRLKSNISQQDQFSLNYEGHYRSQPVELNKSLISSAKGNIDWYAKKLDKHKIKLVNGNSLNPILQWQVEAVTALYDIRLSRGSYWLVAKSNSQAVDHVRQIIRRLLEVSNEIAQVINQIEHGHGQSQITETSALALATDIPLSRNLYFTGREDDIETLDKMLTDKQIAVISAYGGTGKTTMAVEYGYQKRDEGRVVRWFNEHRVQEGYRAIAIELGVPTDSNDKDIIRKMVNVKLAQVRLNTGGANSVNLSHFNNDLLFIFDNIEDLTEVEEYIRDLPQNVKLILTSRQKGLNKSFNELTLTPFSEEQALSYVKKVLNITTQQAELLINTVSTLPFRLNKATAYLLENRLIDVSEYVALYRNLEANNKASNNSNNSAIIDVSPEIEIIFGRLIDREKGSVNALHLLQYCAYLNPDFVPLEIFEDMYDKIQLQHIIKSLEALSLAEYTVNQNKDKGLRLHRFIQDEIKKYAEQHQQLCKSTQEIGKYLLTKLNKLFPKVDDNPDERWKQAEKYASSVEALLNSGVIQEQFRIIQAEIYENLGLYNSLIKQQYRASLKYAKQAFKIKKDFYQANSPEIAVSYNNIGTTLSFLGQIKAALKFHKQALAIRERIYGDNDHPDIAESYNNVGICCTADGKLNQALDYHEKALNMRRILYSGVDHPETVISLNNTGDAYSKCGDADEALKCHKKALTMSQALYDDDHCHIAVSHIGLGGAYLELGQPHKALYHYKLGLSIFEKIYDNNHLYIAKSFANMANCFSALGEEQKAFEYRKEALKKFKLLYPGGHTLIFQALYNLSMSYSKFGYINESLEYKNQALTMMKVIYQGNHPNVAQFLDNMGQYYAKLGNDEKALEYFQEALTMLQAIHQANHPNIASLYYDIGVSYSTLSDKNNALKYFIKALKMRQALYPDNHPEVIESFYSVKITHESLVNEQKVIESENQVSIQKQSQHPDDHPDVIESLHLVGNARVIVEIEQEILGSEDQDSLVRQAQIQDNFAVADQLVELAGNFDEELNDDALEKLQKNLTTQKSIHPDNHPDVAKSLDSLGEFYFKIGRTEESIQYYHQSLEMRRALYPNSHQDTANSYKILGIAYKELGKNPEALCYFNLARNMGIALYGRHNAGVKELEYEIAVIDNMHKDSKKSFVERLVCNRDQSNNSKSKSCCLVM